MGWGWYRKRYLRSLCALLFWSRGVRLKACRRRIVQSSLGPYTIKYLKSESILLSRKGCSGRLTVTNHWPLLVAVVWPMRGSIFEGSLKGLGGAWKHVGAYRICGSVCLSLRAGSVFKTPQYGVCRVSMPTIVILVLGRQLQFGYFRCWGLPIRSLPNLMSSNPPQLPFKTTPMPSTGDHEALSRGTLLRLGTLRLRVRLASFCTLLAIPP